jgi:hypothetical protein
MPVRGTENHATQGAPLARRHIVQWHSVLLNGSAVTR